MTQITDKIRSSLSDKKNPEQTIEKAIQYHQLKQLSTKLQSLGIKLSDTQQDYDIPKMEKRLDYILEVVKLSQIQSYFQHHRYQIS